MYRIDIKKNTFLNNKVSNRLPAIILPSFFFKLRVKDRKKIMFISKTINDLTYRLDIMQV